MNLLKVGERYVGRIGEIPTHVFQYANAEPRQIVFVVQLHGRVKTRDGQGNLAGSIPATLCKV